MDGWQHAGASVLEVAWLKVVQACHFRGSKSRNKVSVGEPAEGSIQIHTPMYDSLLTLPSGDVAGPRMVSSRPKPLPSLLKQKQEFTTISGGSLGSQVDEERS